jgi:hypothetical protein
MIRKNRNKIVESFVEKRELVFLFGFTTDSKLDTSVTRNFDFQTNKRIINIQVFISAYKISKTFRRNVAE